MASSDTYKRAIGLYQAGMLDRAPSAKRSLTSSRTTLKPWICRRWTMSTGSLARRAFKRQQHARDQTRRRCGAGQPRQCPAPAASATRVRGASQPRSGVGRGRRPHHVAGAFRGNARGRARGYSPPFIGPSSDWAPVSVPRGLLMSPSPGYFVGCRARPSRHPGINHEAGRLK